MKVAFTAANALVQPSQGLNDTPDLLDVNAQAFHNALL